MELQWKDNVKARVFDEIQSNTFRKKHGQALSHRSQDTVFDYLKDIGVKKKK
jgi:hypothetical protein